LQLAETGLAEAPDDLALLAVATQAAWLSGALDDALVHAERWLAVARGADDVGAEGEALAHHARGAGRFDDMVDEARLGAKETLALGSSWQALQLAETGLAEAPDDLALLAVATQAAWLSGALDDALVHAERWLAVARGADDVGAEGEALALRVRVAFERGDVDAMTTHTEALIAVVDRLPTDEQRAGAMAAIAQSYMLREQAEETFEWADKAYALADAGGHTRVRLAAMAEKGSMLIIDPAHESEGRELLETTAAEAERLGEPLIAARVLNNLVWHARRWIDVDGVRALIERMRTQADAAGFDALGVDDVAGWLAHLSAVDGDLYGAIAHLDAGLTSTEPRPQPKIHWTAVFRAGLALEAGDVDGAVRFTEMVRPPTARTRVAIVGLDVHVALRRGELATARRLLPDLVAAMDGEGYAAPSQVHDLAAAALAAGLSVDELQPLIDRVGHFVGHRLEPDSPWRRLIDAQVAEARGDVDGAIAGYAAAASAMGTAPDMIAGHWGTAHVGAAANLVRADRLDEARGHAREARRHLDR
ncbi:MAG TPA: hypothetical protein VJM49_22470, partial [Acidimicrobiales bacterium]|nr:hypothetical protein [Acidimicrobiales bacterium]